MGFFDYVSDLYAALSIQSTEAEERERQNAGPEDNSGEQGSAKDQLHIGTAQHRAGVTRGGVSANLGHAGTNEESESEKEANAQDAKKGGSGEQGHKPGDESSKEKTGNIGADRAGPGGGSVKQSQPGKGMEAASSDGGDDEAEEGGDDAGGEETDEGGDKGGDEGGDEGGDDEEEEEEEEEEPEDPMPQLQEECLKTQQCSPLKHHYDECAERVTQQIEEKGKAEEDCVEEFFHMMHCASQCAAPKLFRQLK